MSDGEQDLPPDVVPIPSPPPRYGINLQIICDPSLIFESYFCQMALLVDIFVYLSSIGGVTPQKIGGMYVSLIDCV